MIKIFHLLIFGFVLFNTLQAQNFSSKVSINKIIVGENIITSNNAQLIEAEILNISKQDFKFLVKLEITSPNGKTTLHQNKKVFVRGKSEKKVIFNYSVRKSKRGLYKVGVHIYNFNGRNLLLKARPDQLAFFNVALKLKKNKRKNKHKSGKKSGKKSGRKKEEASSDVTFEPPDLLWEEVTIQKTSLLRGENTVVRMILNNNGGNVTKNIEYTLHWYFKQRPARKILQYKGHINIMAPGESKIYEIPLTIPGTERKGFYSVQAIVKELDSNLDLNVRNNIKVSSNSVRFGDIGLEFPEPDYSFAENGLFLFQWRSLKYNQFKVQISNDPKFENLDGILEMPQGDKWTSKLSITPLVGEMPIMALSLMAQIKKNYLFWRVLARNSEGEQTVSEHKKFFIILSAK